MPVSAVLIMMKQILLQLARFRSRGLALRPVNSNKEVIDTTLLAVGAAVVTTTILAQSINDYVGTVGTCPLGAVIKGLYLFVQILPTAGTANVDWFLMKSPNAIVPPIPGAVGGNVARKFILHEEKGLPGNAADGAYPATFKGVIKIPKSRQRMAEGDTIRILVRGADVYNACIKAIYKWYF